MEEYHFAFGVDANYVKYAGVMMTSIVWNHPGQPICFHLACDGLHEEDKARLETSANSIAIRASSSTTCANNCKV